MAKELKVTFTYEKETKNTMVFAEDLPSDDAKPVIGREYLRKDKYEDLGKPTQIEATYRKVK